MIIYFIYFLVPGATGPMPLNNFLVMSLFIAFAFAMFFMRPSNMRNSDGDSKPHGNGAVSVYLHMTTKRVTSVFLHCTLSNNKFYYPI